MRFSMPAFLLLLPTLVWFWRAAPALPRWRRGARVACVGFIILALSGLELSGGPAALTIAYALDRSHSSAAVAADLDALLKRAQTTMRPEDQAGLVVFGADAVVERTPSRSLAVEQLSSVVRPGGTNIAAALRAARSTLPASGSSRIVLLSDGLQTTGDAFDEAVRAAAAQVPIDVVIPQPPAAATLEIMRVSAPPSTRLGEPFAVVVTARGRPGTRGAIVLNAGTEVRRQQIVVPTEGVVSTAFQARANAAGPQLYDAHVEIGGDFDAADANAHGAVVVVADRPRALYVGASPATLRGPLASAGFDVVTRAPAALPRAARSITDFDAVILDDVHGEALDAAQRTALAAYAQQYGGGILFLGSAESLEAGQLANDPLGDMLPVDFRPRAGERAPSLALVIAFDKSGSMDDRVGGVPRIEFARQAVARVFEAVPGSDAIGVIAFDTQAHDVAPLRAAQELRTVTTALAAVQPGGGTAIAPAIERAARWLKDAALPQGAKRHVLLVSDGATSPADAARARDLARGGGFELSVVALGADAERTFLDDLARSANGRAYFPNDIRELPVLAARESVRVAGGRLVTDPFQPRALDHPALNGIDTRRLPLLGGYVVGAAKPLAQVVLQSPLGDPVLATARAGLGRVAIYTSDLESAWSTGFRAWTEFPRLMAQTTRWVSRRVRDELLFADFVADGDDLRFVVEAQQPDGHLLTGLTAAAVVRGPDADTTTLPLTETAPGRYEARLAAPERGAHVIEITAVSTDGRIDARILRGTYWSAPAEYRRSGIDAALLRRIAELSGGRILTPADDPFAAPRDNGSIGMRPWLTGAALAAFLLEVLLPSRRRPAPGAVDRPGKRSVRAAA